MGEQVTGPEKQNLYEIILCQRTSAKKKLNYGQKKNSHLDLKIPDLSAESRSQKCHFVSGWNIYSRKKKSDYALASENKRLQSQTACNCSVFPSGSARLRSQTNKHRKLKGSAYKTAKVPAFPSPCTNRWFRETPTLL